MSRGQSRDMPEAYTARYTSPDYAADTTADSKAAPGADTKAVPDGAAEAEGVHGDEIAAVLSPEAGIASDAAPSAAPSTEGDGAASTAADREAVANTVTAAAPNDTAEVAGNADNAAPDSASVAEAVLIQVGPEEVEQKMAANDAAIAVRNNMVEVEVAGNADDAAPDSAPAAEAVPIQVGPKEVEEKMVANDAAIAVRNNTAEVEVAGNADDAVPDDGVRMVADNNDGILLNGEIGAVAGGKGGGGGAAARQEEAVMGDAVPGALGEDIQPPTSAGTTDTTAATSTSWLGWVWKAKRAIVAATLPGGKGTATEGETGETPSSPDGKQRLGAGWRPYPGAAPYRRDFGVMEDVGAPGRQNMRALRHICI